MFHYFIIKTHLAKIKRRIRVSQKGEFDDDQETHSNNNEHNPRCFDFGSDRLK